MGNSKGRQGLYCFCSDTLYLRFVFKIGVIDMRNQLLILIKQRGNCDYPIRIECPDCFLSTECSNPISISDLDTIDLDTLERIYKVALEEYIDRYGRDIDLMEVLI